MAFALGDKNFEAVLDEHIPGMEVAVGAFVSSVGTKCSGIEVHTSVLVVCDEGPLGTELTGGFAVV